MFVMNRASAGRVIGPIAISAWLVAVVIGMGLMLHYQMTPNSASAAAVSQWPAAARVQRDPTRPTLIMIVHPHCPCSRASLAELSQIMSRAQGGLSAHVLFVEPHGAPQNWEKGELWTTASAIPGVAVSVDDDGKDTDAFGATTSGGVILYDAGGRMLFNGGITDGRGHEGDNPGELAILSLLRHADPGIKTTPVYGCPLRSGVTSCRVGNRS